MEANAEDLKNSIAAARKDIGGEYAVQLDSVAGNSNAYVEVVRNIIAQGAVDRNSVAQIMEAGDKADGGIEGVRSPLVVKPEALDEQQSTLTSAVMGHDRKSTRLNSSHISAHKSPTHECTQ